MFVDRLRVGSAGALSAVVVAAFAFLACSSGGPPAHAEAGTDAALAHDAAEVEADPHDSGAPSIVELSVSGAPAEGGASPALVPPFSSEIHDYYVRCSVGVNAFTIRMKASLGASSEIRAPSRSASLPAQTVTVKVRENDAVVAAAVGGGATTEYWVRCLPDDFPELSMRVHPDHGTAPPGYYLVGDFSPANKRAYAMVLDGHGVPVWYHLAPESSVGDVDSIFPGTVSFIWSTDFGFEVRQLRPPSTRYVATGVPALDGHDLRALPGGGELVITAPLVAGVDLTGLRTGLPDGGTAVFGPDSTIQDCELVELDAKGRIVWRWSVFNHFDPAKTSTAPWFAVSGTTIAADGAAVIDPFHCNSVDVDPVNGSVLVSARNMDAVFYVDRKSGEVLWKLGGTASSRQPTTFVPIADPFYRQHDARLLPGWNAECQGGNGAISLFDDESFAPGTARAVVYDVIVGSLDAGTTPATCADGGAAEAGATGKATVAWQYRGATSSDSLGSFRISADGSRVIGWGQSRTPNVVFTEVDALGHDLLDFEFPDGNISYRAIKVPQSALDLDAMRETAGTVP